jgi:hypothetical protein
MQRHTAAQHAQHAAMTSDLHQYKLLARPHSTTNGNTTSFIHVIKNKPFPFATRKTSTLGNMHPYTVYSKMTEATSVVRTPVLWD